MSGAAFSSRLQQFRQKFKEIVTPKRYGYDELAQLEQPLVSSSGEAGALQGNDSYTAAHGVPRPGAAASGARTGQGISTTQLPNQSEELRQLAALGKEAAEILWEMTAMQDQGEAAKEMLEKATQLQAQLRGMISDYSDTDEGALSFALQQFDLLSNTLSEYHLPTSPNAPQNVSPGVPAPAGSITTARLQPPQSHQNPFQSNPFGSSGATAPGEKAQADEAPLISFD